MKNILTPDYYEKFHCIGAECEDSCCSGWWTVSVDRETYLRYEQCQLPALKPLFKLAIRRNDAPSDQNQNDYGFVQMQPDGGCHFLQTDQQCAIHQQMGAVALSDTCRIYPRYLNRFGNQREKSLGISCPEAARLILLNPQPIQFELSQPEPEIDAKPFASYQFPRQSAGDAAQISVLNDFRALIIGILQCRELSIGARMMLVGFLLEDAQKITNSAEFSHANELLPTLQTYAGMLAQPAKIEAQFLQIQPNNHGKLALVSQIIQHALSEIASVRFKACLDEVLAGLQLHSHEVSAASSQSFHEGYQDYFQPFFSQKMYIFEHYLVNQVLTRLFPFTRDNYLNLFAELVGNLVLLEVLLVGIAAHNQALTEEKVIQLFQTFARHSNHHRGYLQQLLSAMQVHPNDAFVKVMWLLKS